MSQFLNSIFRYFHYTVLLFISLTSIIMSVYANEYDQIIFGLNPFSRIISSINTISGAITPFVSFAFICITSKIMLRVMEERISMYEITQAVAYGFIPVLLSTLFYTITIILFRSEITAIDNISELYSIKFFLELSFVDLERISLAAWALSYAVIIYLFFVKLRLSFFSSFISAVVPTLIVVLLRLFFSEIV